MTDKKNATWNGTKLAPRAGRMTKFKGKAASIAPGLAVVAASLLVSGEAAQAADECGVAAPGGSVNCVAGSYATGITYVNADGITVNLNNAGIDVPDGGIDVTTLNGTAASTTINLNNFGTIANSGASQHGVIIQSTTAPSSGDATIVMDAGTINTNASNADGLFIFRPGPGANHAGNNAIIFNGGTINAVGGSSSQGLIINNAGGGATSASEIIVNGGDITTNGVAGHGAYIFSGPNITSAAAIPGLIAERGARITMTGGTINTGDRSKGLWNQYGGVSGDATIRMSGGTINTNGQNSQGVYAQIGTSSAGAQTGRAFIDITGGTIDTGTGLNSHGVWSRVSNTLATGGASSMVEGATVTTGGDTAHGVYGLNSGLGIAGATARSGATITTTGAGADGARGEITNTASLSSASANSNGANITTNGNAAIGVHAVNAGLGGTVVQLDSGQVSTGGLQSHGLHASSLNAASNAFTYASLVSGAVTTVGNGSNGVFAESAGSGFTLLEMENGTVTTGGTGARGIYGLNHGLGEVVTTMYNGDITTTGAGSSGAQAEITNAANTSAATVEMLDGTISTSGGNASGVYAINNGLGTASAQMSSGQVSTIGGQGHGINATTSNTANNSTILARMTGGSIRTTGDDSTGVFSENGGGTGLTSAVLVDGNVSTSGINSHGVSALSTSGLTTALGARAEMFAGTVDTTGQNGFGLSSFSFGGSALTEIHDGSITTSGPSASGLVANVQTTAGSSVARTNVLGGTIVTTGNNSSGAFSFNQGTAGGSVATMSSGSISTFGTQSNGLLAFTNLFGTQGNAAAQMDGGSIVTSGDQSSGVYALIFSASGTGDVTSVLTGGSVVTTGADAHGLHGLNTGTGNVSVSSASGVTVSGVGSDGLRADAAGGGTYDVDVTAGTVIGGSGAGAGIHTIGAGGGTIDIASGATIDGSAGQAGVVDDAGAVVLNSAGTIMNGIAAGAGDDVANLNVGSITTGNIAMGNGSDVLLIATGADISGVTLLDGGDDHATADGFIDALTFQNQTLNLPGTFITNWETLNVDGGSLSITDGALTVGSDAGRGLFVRSGGVFDGGTGLALTGNANVLAGSMFRGFGGGAGTYSISGALSNLGTVTTQDGSVGDAVTVAGDYSGGGQLLVDVDFATDTADTLNVGGNVTAGTTFVGVSDVSSGMSTGNDVLVVDVAGTTAAGDFALAGGPVSSGAYTYNLDLLGASWFLTSVANPTGAVYESAPYVLGTIIDLPTLEQRVGQRQYLTAENGDGQIARGAWMRAYGDRYDITPSRSTSGATIDGSSGGIQFGYDALPEVGDNGQWVFGITGQYGTVSSTVTNAQGNASIDGEGFGLGATATWYGNDGLYFDAQAQINWLNSDYTTNGATLASGQDAMGYGVSAEVGKRFALSETASLIPQAQLSWFGTDTDAFTDNLGNAVDLGSHDSVVGRLGLAYERENLEAKGGPAKLYVIGNLLKDFSSDSSVNVAGAPLTASYNDTWAEIGLGGSKVWDDNKMFYGEASYRQSLSNSSSSGLSLTAGFRVTW